MLKKIFHKFINIFDNTERVLLINIITIAILMFLMSICKI
jgi:hypothetical protein